MGQQPKRKSGVSRAPKRDIAGPAYRRFERMIMRPDDALFVAGAIVSCSVFAWLVTVW